MGRGERRTNGIRFRGLRSRLLLLRPSGGRREERASTDEATEGPRDDWVPVSAWEWGYVFGNGEFVEVSEYRPDSVVISSGDHVRIRSGEQDEWMVTGRSDRPHGIAVAKDGTFKGVPLEEFLTCNPRYLIGQVVRYRDRRWLVADVEGETLALQADGHATRAPSRDVVSANVDDFRKRAVILVDKG